MKKQYNFQKKAEESKTAKAFHSNVHISTKYSTEMARELLGKKVKWAKSFLQDIIEKKRYLPLRRYRIEMGHRKGTAQSHTKSGRFPKILCQKWLELLEQAEANADYKGLDTSNLVIIHAFASQGFRRLSHQPLGKIGGKQRKKKSTHIEVIVREVGQ